MIMIMISLGIFNIFHFSIVIKNYTTFEFVTNIVRPGLDPNTKSMYDISFWCNIIEVYGNNPLFWLLPIDVHDANMYNNGINFKLNTKYEYEIIKSV